MVELTKKSTGTGMTTNYVISLTITEDALATTGQITTEIAIT